MKRVFIVGMALIALSCSTSNSNKNNMEEAPIIEMVSWQAAKGYGLRETQEAMLKLNGFIKEQPGFVARQTSIAKDGSYLDLVYWTDLTLAHEASERAMKNEDLQEAFAAIDHRSMVFKHFEVFNQISAVTD